MSPTIFKMLSAIERRAQQDARAEFFELRASGYSSHRAGYYSARVCWPDAHTLLRNDLRYRFADGSRVATFYGSHALRTVGL